MRVEIMYLLLSLSVCQVPPLGYVSSVAHEVVSSNYESLFFYHIFRLISVDEEN